MTRSRIQVALETGTGNVAAHLGPREGLSQGVIRATASVDLVLLDANPLENIANTTRIAGVMVGGRWLPKSEIDRRLGELRAR